MTDFLDLIIEGNILTFNPGWDTSGKDIEEFDDIRTIENMLKQHSIPLDKEVGETTSGPGSIVLKDPDGNVIMLDQHR